MFKIKQKICRALFRKIAAEQELYLPVSSAGQVNFAAWEEEAEVSLETIKNCKIAQRCVFSAE